MRLFDASRQFVVRRTMPADFDGIRALSLRVYPFMRPWGAAQLQSHLDLFPAGQLVVEQLAASRIVGMAASLIVCWDDYEIDDDWRDFTDHGYFTNHDPANGHTLYGAEIMVDPDFRSLGLGKLIYMARRRIVREHGLLRIRAGARLRGYGSRSASYSPLEYLLRVVRGEVFDPTVSFQMRQGFHVMALVKSYLPDDPETLGWAVVIEWLNPEVALPEHYARQVQRYASLFGPLGASGRDLHDGVCRMAQKNRDGRNPIPDQESKTG